MRSCSSRALLQQRSGKTPESLTGLQRAESALAWIAEARRKARHPA